MYVYIYIYIYNPPLPLDVEDHGEDHREHQEVHPQQLQGVGVGDPLWIYYMVHVVVYAYKHLLRETLSGYHDFIFK